MKRVFAFVKKFVSILRQTVKTKELTKNASKEYSPSLKVENINDSEETIIKLYQRRYFKEEIDILEKIKNRSQNSLRNSRKTSTLDPFLDDKKILRAGGRLKRSNINLDYVHPIVLSGEGIVTNLIIKWYHQSVGLGRRGYTLNKIRSSGYWIVKANSVVRSCISKCVTYRYLRGKVGEQKMADFPTDRLSIEPPFAYIGLNMFGPFLIKQHRKEMKTCAIIFTCLSSCAVHLEVVYTMETDSFIQSLRRFVAHLGNICLIRCDNGTNFTGAQSELQKAFSEVDDEQISYFLKKLDADWIAWRKNPPSGSHMGGIWECQIRSAQAILLALMKQHGTSLNDESLVTLLVEVESIINSRPLTLETISDMGSVAPLCSNNLLTMKTNVVL